MNCDPLSGDWFVFKNPAADELKILAWMGDGFVQYLRRRECGTFAFPRGHVTDATGDDPRWTRPGRCP